MKTIAGLLAGEIKQKTTPAGDRLTEFGVRLAKDTFVRVTAWNTLADVAASFQRGDIVQVTGDYSEKEIDGRIYKNITARYLAIQKYPTGSFEIPRGFELADDRDDIPFA